MDYGECPDHPPPAGRATDDQITRRPGGRAACDKITRREGKEGGAASRSRDLRLTPGPLSVPLYRAARPAPNSTAHAR